MEAKEKALELWATYRFALSIKNAPLGEQKDLIAKQCALIAVDEILDMNELCEKMGTYTVFFWQEVKQEIEKL